MAFCCWRCFSVSKVQSTTMCFQSSSKLFDECKTQRPVSGGHQKRIRGTKQSSDKVGSVLPVKRLFRVLIGFEGE